MTRGLKLADILARLFLMMNAGARDAPGVVAWSRHQRVMSRQTIQQGHDTDITSGL